MAADRSDAGRAERTSWVDSPGRTVFDDGTGRTGQAERIVRVDRIERFDVTDHPGNTARTSRNDGTARRTVCPSTIRRRNGPVERIERLELVERLDVTDHPGNRPRADRVDGLGRRAVVRRTIRRVSGVVRYRLDSTWIRTGDTGRIVLAGSPLRLFRLTDPGARLVDAIESGRDPGASSLVDRLLDAGAIHPERSADGPHRFDRDDVTVVTPQLGGVPRRDGRITVDDGSIPALAGADVRIERNRGPAAARNVGRQRVATALIAFVDSDVDLLDAESTSHGGSVWLDALLPHFDDPLVGLVAPRVIGEPGSSLDLGDEPARIRAGSRVGYVPAAAIVVRADALDDVGGFDERLRFGEDVDLVWRLDDAGWRCRYEPSSQVWHRPRSSLVKRLAQQAAYGSSAAPLAMRHPQSLAPLRSNGWTATVWICAGLGHPMIAAALAASTAAALVPKLCDVPPRRSLRLAMVGHVAAFTQIAAAIRRTWWPIVTVLALASRRARWVALVAIAADVRSAPNDLAYGWGVWRGMLRLRTWRPIVPSISAWPPARQRRRRPATGAVRKALGGRRVR